MPNLQIVEKEEPSPVRSSFQPDTMRLIIQWAVGVLAAAALGTWLVWWGAYLQRTSAMEEIREACQRLMPATTDRCVDTVIVQRGGSRR